MPRTSSAGHIDRTQVLTALITGLAGAVIAILSGVAAPLADFYLGRTVPRELLESELKSREIAEQTIKERDKKLLEAIMIQREADLKFADLQSQKAKVDDQLSAAKRIINTYNTEHKTLALAPSSTAIFPGTDLRVRLTGITDLGDGKFDTQLETHGDGAYIFSLDSPTQFILTQNDSNCQVTMKEIYPTLAVFEAECTATK